MLVGAGAAGSSVDAANILKPALSRGELQVHRRDDPGRVPQAHRERRRPRTPLPADRRRRAHDRRDHRDPQGHQDDAYEEHHRLSHLRRSPRSRRQAVGALRLRPLPARQGHRPDRRGFLARAHVQEPRCRPPARDIVRATARSCARTRTVGHRATGATTTPVELELRRDRPGKPARAPAHRLGPLQQPAAVTADDIAEVVAMWTGVPGDADGDRRIGAPAPHGRGTAPATSSARTRPSTPFPRPCAARAPG